MKTPAKRMCVWLVLGLILGIHRGYIALWQDGAAEPSTVYPYKAALLPPQAQARLTEGIVIRDEDQLNELLMNYLS